MRRGGAFGARLGVGSTGGRTREDFAPQAFYGLQRENQILRIHFYTLLRLTAAYTLTRILRAYEVIHGRKAPFA
jgi:hypothetical protein